MYVFVLDTNKQPLAPCHPGKARKLLDNKKAAVFKRFPFTVILKESKQEVSVPNIRVKIDPGSKFTGLALLHNNKVIWGAEINHRGSEIKSDLLSRSKVRSNRRNRKTRYRPARFNNRSRPKGWLAPSLMSRVYNIMTWVNRLQKLCPISDISLELSKFDTQKMDKPEISGVEYQQGELVGYEVREYLLEKWGRKCAYCGKKHVPLQIEHIIPKARGGSNRVSNLTLACEQCNVSKGKQTAEEFGYEKIQSKAKSKRPLKDAAVMNSTRWKLFNELKSIGLNLEISTGSMTKYNRFRLGFKKTHWLDAACVGKSTPNDLSICLNNFLSIKAEGHGNRKLRVNRKGSHKGHNKKVSGLMTHDMVDVYVHDDKKILKTSGKYTSGISSVSRTKPKQFCLSVGKNWWVHIQYLTKAQSADGYDYSYQKIS